MWVTCGKRKCRFSRLVTRSQDLMTILLLAPNSSQKHDVLCVYVCVWEREREGDRERGRERERWWCLMIVLCCTMWQYDVSHVVVAYCKLLLFLLCAVGYSSVLCYIVPTSFIKQWPWYSASWSVWLRGDFSFNLFQLVIINPEVLQLNPSQVTVITV